MDRRIRLWVVRAALSYRSRGIRAGVAVSWKSLKSQVSRGLYPAGVALDDAPFTRSV